MREFLNNRLLQYRLDAPDDEAFLNNVNTLHIQFGTEALVAFFDFSAGITLETKDVERHWNKFQQHWTALAKTLNRKVSITTAMCDYLSTTSDLISHPKLIEALRYETVFYNTTHDKLTGLYNRHYFDGIFSQQVAMARRYKDNLSILFLDIDNFKDINDTYGHAAGDEVLRNVAEILNACKRDSDIVARFGGEEFILLMSRTDNVSAMIVGERLRKRIEETLTIYQEHQIRQTISGGIASYPHHSNNTEELLQMADSALYQAKGAGKNLISAFKSEKRRYLRVQFSQPILAKELAFKNSQTYEAKSNDICVGGLLFENPTEIPVGALITVQVHVDSGPPVLLIGNVVRVTRNGTESYDIGMTTSFKTMDQIVHRRIANILHNKSFS
jgi:diguanylate cyclase (GGDEF)-like protein